jgi:hypothetical protein
VEIELWNDFREPNYWYREGDGRKTDLEGFLEHHFLKEVPSELQLIRFGEAHFPEHLFSRDDVGPAIDAEVDTATG